MSQQQIQTQNLLNKLVAQMTAKINCGPSCQKDKKSQELKQKYEIAKENLREAPENLAEARKNYFSFAYGNKFNNELKKKEATVEVNKDSKEKTKQFNNIGNQIKNLLNDYEVVSVSVKNTKDLLSKISEENNNLKNKIDDETETSATSDRRVFYEQQYISWIDYYLNWLKKIYWYAFAIFVIIFIYFRQYTNYRNLLLIIFFMSLPYIINTGINQLITLWRYGL